MLAPCVVVVAVAAFAVGRSTIDDGVLGPPPALAAAGRAPALLDRTELREVDAPVRPGALFRCPPGGEVLRGPGPATDLVEVRVVRSSDLVCVEADPGPRGERGRFGFEVRFGDVYVAQLSFGRERLRIRAGHPQAVEHVAGVRGGPFVVHVGADDRRVSVAWSAPSLPAEARFVPVTARRSG